MKIAELRKHRDMPFVKIGMRVQLLDYGPMGRISGVNDSGNLNVIFDGEKHHTNCHPHWMIRYFDKNGKVIQEYRT